MLFQCLCGFELVCHFTQADDEPKKFIRSFFLSSGILLILIAAAVIVVDPFYHYHGPLPGLKAVVTKSEYQCIGTVRNFEYDSMILGSSRAENYNNRWFDEAFGAKTVKGIKRSATTEELLYYLKEAFARKKLANVFYCMDISSLQEKPKGHFPDDSLPLYLYNTDFLDDVYYFWNKDVIFEYIPYLVVMGTMGEYDEGESYNWAQYKTFSAQGALSQYERPERITKMEPADKNRKAVEENLHLLGEIIKEHPETEFRFIFAPYSMLWWDEEYRNGASAGDIETVRQAVEYLLEFENAQVYYFQNDARLVTDLNNYMDPIHFSQEINEEIVRRMKADENRLTKENYESELAKMTELVLEIEHAYIGEYFVE